MAQLLIKRTHTPNNPPTLVDGELGVEMAGPVRLWVGVPTSIDPSGRKLLIDTAAAASEFVELAGDTMTGPLILSGDPTAPLGAVTKQYSDAKVARSGDTLTGTLVLVGDPVNPLEAATKSYVDLRTGSKTPIYTDGSTAMTAALTLSGNPVNPTDAADKAYVDAAVGAVQPPAAFPSGTTMLFYQAAAPVGWTQVTTHNDKALRVVSGAGGGSGGTNPFSTVMAQTTVGNHTLTLGETPGGITSGGTPTITVYPGGNSGLGVPYCTGGFGLFNSTAYSSGNYVVWAGNNSGFSYTGSFSAANNIGVTSNNTGGGAHNHPITMQIQYVDVIIASKN